MWAVIWVPQRTLDSVCRTNADCGASMACNRSRGPEPERGLCSCLEGHISLDATTCVREEEPDGGTDVGCKGDADCSDDMECLGTTDVRQCQCRSGFVTTQEGLCGLGAGMRCTPGAGDCGDGMSCVGDEGNEMCKCDEGMRLRSDGYCGGIIKASCEFDYECADVMLCVDEVCSCSHNTFIRTDGTCGLKHGQRCSRVEQCADHMLCSTQDDVTVCKCDKQHIAHSSGACVPQKLGSSSSACSVWTSATALFSGGPALLLVLSSLWLCFQPTLLSFMVLH
ncbi:hypothetical protein BaRGS_00008285 [Batillaria attramentaria]|uniref:Uncharacterized protein n=1 Tax=Batillaria attramentaria TaxID=370345 RepID=A0ABD0LLQ7_9CAEN